MAELVRGIFDPRKAAVQAVLWAALGSLLFSFMFALPKFAGTAADPLQATWFRYIGGVMVVLMIAAARTGLSARAVAAGLADFTPLRPINVIPFHIARAVCGVGTVACAIYAVTQIPLATAVAIGMTNGVFVILLAAVFLREKLTPLLLFAGGLSLSGGIIAAEPDLHNPAQFFTPGAAVAFLGAIFWACETTLLKFTASRDHPIAMLAVVNISAALITLVPAIIFWRDLPFEFLLIYAIMGPIAISGQFCNIAAYRLAHASVLVPVKYSGLIFAALIGIAIFGEIPSAALVTGATMIVFGGALAMHVGRLQNKPV